MPWDKKTCVPKRHRRDSALKRCKADAGGRPGEVLELELELVSAVAQKAASSSTVSAGAVRANSRKSKSVWPQCKLSCNWPPANTKRCEPGVMPRQASSHSSCMAFSGAGTTRDFSSPRPGSAWSVTTEKKRRSDRTGACCQAHQVAKNCQPKSKPICSTCPCRRCSMTVKFRGSA